MNSIFVDSFQSTLNQLYAIKISGANVQLDDKSFDQILALNKDKCGILAGFNSYAARCEQNFKLTQKIVF